MSEWDLHFPVEEVGERNGHYMVKTFRLREPLDAQVSSWEELTSLGLDIDGVEFQTKVMSTRSTNEPKVCYKCRECGVETSGGAPTVYGIPCDS